MAEYSHYDPPIFEDVLAVEERLNNRIIKLDEYYDDLLNDFCDLLQLIMDEHLVPERLKESIKERFYKPKTETK